MAGERPTGISVLAGLAAIGSAIGAFVILSAANNDVGWLPCLLAIATVVVAGATAHGLWALRWWAWPVALAMWTGAGVQAVLSLGKPTISTDLVVAPVAVVYLLRPDIRGLFGGRVATPSRAFVAATALLAAVVASAPIAGQVASQWVPTVPPSAPSTLVAQIAVPKQGGDAASGGDPVGLGNECLKRDVRAAGWVDLCWSVVRQPDADPAGDYYSLQVRGTFGADAQDGTAGGSGIRWIAVRGVLAGAVVDGVTDIEPLGTVEGCPGGAGMLPPVALGQATLELPCDGTTVGGESGLGTAPGHPHTATVTWSCRGCLFSASKHERAIGLADTVKVAEGAQPGWQLYVDFGG